MTLGLVLFLAACNVQEEQLPTDAQIIATEIAPVLEARCVSCHVAGGAASFALDDPDEILVWREAIIDAVVTRRMPPWGMEPSCRPTEGDLRLTDDEVALFQA